MKFYLSHAGNAVQAIEIDKLDITNADPLIKNCNKDLIRFINNIFISYNLQPFNDNDTEVKLNADQVLALILSSKFPVYPNNENLFQEFALPFTASQEWLDLASSLQHQNNKNIDSRILPKIKDAVTRFSRKASHPDLQQKARILLENCELLIQTQRYHSLLPTAKMLQAGRAELYSDHLPQLFTVHGIKCVSWNILHPELYSGYYPFNDLSLINKAEIEKLPREQQENAYREAQKAQINKRAERICESLIQIIKLHQPHVVVLQENFLDDEILPKLVTSLKQVSGQHWEFKKEGSKGLITFYNADLYECKSEHYDNGCLTTHLSSQVNKGTTIDVHNVHISHEEIPFTTEERTKKLLQSNPQGQAIVAGDFNSRIPQDKNFLVTGVTPPQFGSEVQGCDWTDGCYGKNNSSQVVQSFGQVIDPRDGNLWKVEAYTPAEFATASLAQRNELYRLRPTMGIMYDRNASDPSLGGKSLSVVEDALKKSLDDPNLKVCWATNAFNQKGFVIVSDKLTNYKKQFPKEIITRTMRQKGGAGDITLVMMCCDGDKLKEFTNYLKSLEAKVTQVKFTTHTGLFASSAAIYDIDSSLDPRNSRLLDLSRFNVYLPEKPQNVDKVRSELKAKIQEFIERNSMFSKFLQLCAQLTLANYHLHFTEYTVEERQNMGNSAIPLIRPSHFQVAMGMYLNICETFATENIYLLTPVQRQIIKDNLIALGRNIEFIYEGLSGKFDEQVELFEKREKNYAANPVRVSQIVSNLLKLYQQVLGCQNLLLAKETAVWVETKAEKGACNICLVNTGIKLAVNLVKTYLEQIYPKPTPKLVK